MIEPVLDFTAKRPCCRIAVRDLTDPINRHALFTVLKREGMSQRDLAVLLDAIDSAMGGMVKCGSD